MAANEEGIRSDLPAKEPRPASAPSGAIQSFDPVESGKTPPPSTGIQEEHLLPDDRAQPRERATFLIGASYSKLNPWPWCVLVLVGLGAFPITVQFLTRKLSEGHFIAWSVWLSLLFLAVGYVLLRRQHHLRFTEQGVQTDHPRQALDYEEIMQVYAPERLAESSASFDIYLLHAYGYLKVSQSYQADSQRVYEFLQAQSLAERNNPPVPGVMQLYLTHEVRTHGPAKVHVYRSHLRIEKAYSNRFWEHVTGAMFIGGILAILLMLFLWGGDNHKLALQDDDVKIVFLIVMVLCTMLIILGGFGLVACTFTRWMGQLRYYFHKETALIISPGGLAVKHGHKTIVLSWDDLRSGAEAGVLMQDDPTPELRVWKGHTRIRLRDTMHWPLRHALEQIRSYID